ncbi:MAG: HAMP domain-containing histidine kinase [Deltaproteobacteria bacterium]|nr:HAMP domain-containing histidine kinase [Deltaproteobacteria bacterium]
MNRSAAGTDSQQSVSGLAKPAITRRKVTRFLVLAASFCAAVLAGGALTSSLGEPLRASVAAAAVGGFFACIIGPVALALFDRHSNAEPAASMLDPLAHALAPLSTKQEIREAVERCVARTLPCQRASLFVLGAPDNHRDSYEVPGGAREHERRAVVEIRRGDCRLAWLVVERDAGSPALTESDRNQLCAAADVIALSLALARSCEEFAQRSVEHSEAWRAQRAALLETIASEIAHEIRYPINYFRSVFRRGSACGSLDAEEIEIGCEEVERLERLVSGLRRLPRSRLDRTDVRIDVLVSRAETLLRDKLGDRKVSLSGASTETLHCDVDQATQVLVNLLSNAVDAVGAEGDVGVSWTGPVDGVGKLVVWDSGPGFSEKPSRLFVPWCTTKPGGTGLGLTIAHRIVQAHGWEIDAERRGDRTCFEIRIPQSDVATSTAWERRKSTT